jgi:hypothetical protein
MTTQPDLRRWSMWEWVLPLALLAGFLLLWWVIIPKAGVPT